MMLRPWVGLIALGLGLWLLWRLGVLAWVGGALLAAAVLKPVWERWRRGRRKARALQRAAHLDWSVIEQSLRRERLQRDCERPETLGVCTGRDCLVYDHCDFNIKKPL
jgi:hypothetical protein